MILLKDQQRETVEVYIQNLTQHVDVYNNTEEKLYKLRFSYGMVGGTKSHESIFKLMEYAEQLMYEQKQSKNK